MGALLACAARGWAGPLVAATLFAAAPAAAIEGAAGAMKVLRAGPQGFPTLVRPEPSSGVAPKAVTFRVTYQGFTPAARAAFQRAVDIWSRQITSSVPVTVSASFQPLGDNVLGRAGPSAIWRNFPGAPRAGTYYIDALANKFAGAQVDPAPDIVAQFSSIFGNWHYGSGPAPANSFDFTSVVLHELGHGLGFAGAGRVVGAKGSVRADGTPLTYDRFIENRAGTGLLAGFPTGSVALAAQLQGSNLFFDSPQVRAATGNLRARIYAPSVYQRGSSYSHLDEATYLPGNVNSLMTPSINPGKTIRNPGPITRAIFTTLGW